MTGGSAVLGAQIAQAGEGLAHPRLIGTILKAGARLVSPPLSLGHHP